MAFRPASDPRFLVCGQSLANEKFEDKRNRICACADTNEDAEALSGSSMDELIWKMLSEELLDIIVSRLPFAAQCRFRCVCKRWRGIQSVPSRTVLSQSEYGTARFYCESERKWFRVPSNNPSSLGGNSLTDIISPDGQQSSQGKWKVVDVEGGLLCYQLDVEGRPWFRICNLLGKSMSRLIVPTYSRRHPPKSPKVKLLVDRANQAFKMIALLDRLNTAVYDSTTSMWVTHMSHIGSHPRYGWLELFSWENVIYAYTTRVTLGHRVKFGHHGILLASFNTESGKWTRIEVEVPSSELEIPTQRYFVSDSSQLLLVRFSNRTRPRPYLSVWKLLGSSTTSDDRHKWTEWQQIIQGVEGVDVDLVGHCLTSVCCGPEYMCFGFRVDNIFLSRKCVRYSFAAKSWSMMQWPGIEGSSGNFTLHDWEPNLDIDPNLERTLSTP